MTDKLEINLPFSGFYNSYHDAVFDDMLERDLAYYGDELGASDEELEKLSELYWDADFNKVHSSYLSEYLPAFTSELSDLTGVTVELTFDKLVSPKEYNFTTDTLAAFISKDSVKALYEAVDKDNLASWVKERHSSRDGFISFYSNSLEEWLEKPAVDWDHNQLETLIYAFFDDMAEFDEWESSIVFDICSGTIQNCYFEGATEAYKELDAKLWQRDSRYDSREA